MYSLFRHGGDFLHLNYFLPVGTYHGTVLGSSVARP